MKLFALLFIILMSLNVRSQNTYEVYLEPLNINNLPGIQSFAYGKYDGKIIIIGGRTDGLHKRQPFAAFDKLQNNTNIFLIDPINNQIWEVSLDSIKNTSIIEQLQSANIEFYQQDSMLYLIGGYGFSNTANDHITYANLTAINLNKLMNGILHQGPISTSFRQISHSFLAVTGGRLGKIDNTYYLAGGNRFDGRYNPMGHSTYVQTYTNAIRKFKIQDDGVNLNVYNLDSIVDQLQLHRRDYNLVPEISPQGKIGYTMFSGVFQPTVNLPFLNTVNFDSAGDHVNNNFNQFLNHYHCPTFAGYDGINNRMHYFFFGGISQYYIDSNANLIKDDEVPFVKTITRITREPDGTMTEIKLPIEMPGLLGSGGEFILNNLNPHYSNEVIKFDLLTEDTTFVGYIFGGILSTAPNIFFTNTGSESTASNNMYKVFITKNKDTGIRVKKAKALEFNLFSNPSQENLIKFTYNGENESQAYLIIQNIQGEIIDKLPLVGLKISQEQFVYKYQHHLQRGIYILSISANQKIESKKLIIN